MRRVTRVVLVGLAALVALLAVGLGARAWQTAGRDLAPWHTAALEEMSAAALDAADWPAWLAAEAAVFDALRERVTERVAVGPPEHRVAANRYFAGGPMHAPGLARDWNRSFVLEPDGPPVGAAVLLHGLTDSPYSVRHLAEMYRARGFVAVAPRMPGHGTAPSGLVGARWEDWAATTRLALREARRRAGEDRPLHLVGYSNGGALALMAALDAVGDARLPRAARLVLLSPMVGVTEFARFAGLAGLPALLPAFAGAAWLGLVPEYNPFKYNSFPAGAARQSWLLSSAVRDRLARLSREGRLGDMPPVLAFQSVADATVSTPAVVSALFARLPANGSELVLFDVNRDARLGPLLRPEAAALAETLVPPGPRTWRLTLVANRPGSAEAEERVEPAGAVAPPPPRPLGLAWPREVFSLSHVALPFPVSDGLYGLDPDPAEGFGVRLGALAVASRGERGVLAVGLDALLRLQSNPFFPYLAERIAEGLPPPR